MDAEKLNKHCGVEIANYANPINTSCDGLEEGHKLPSTIVTVDSRTGVKDPEQTQFDSDSDNNMGSQIPAAPPRLLDLWRVSHHPPPRDP